MRYKLPWEQITLNLILIYVSSFPFSTQALKHSNTNLQHIQRENGQMLFVWCKWRSKNITNKHEWFGALCGSLNGEYVFGAGSWLIHLLCHFFSLPFDRGLCYSFLCFAHGPPRIQEKNAKENIFSRIISYEWTMNTVISHHWLWLWICTLTAIGLNMRTFFAFFFFLLLHSFAFLVYILSEYGIEGITFNDTAWKITSILFVYNVHTLHVIQTNIGWQCLLFWFGRKIQE